MAEHSPHLAHHFENLEQQNEANTLGMWTFLVSEMLFFGVLFAVYLVYRTAYPAAFEEGSRHLDVVLGSINTGILLTSGLAMALAVHAAQTDKRRALAGWLLVAGALGLVFVGIKGVEYFHKYEEHLVPGLTFVYEGANAMQAKLFFGLYFTMTGIHLLHLLIGVGVLVYFVFSALRGRYDGGNYMPVEMFGLYWHFVDVVWIFLFPMLYLINRT